MFDIALYALAIVAVLWLRAERPTVATATPAPVEVAPIVDDLPSLPELMAEAEAMTEGTTPDLALLAEVAAEVPAQPAAIAAPVVVAVVEVADAPTEFAAMTAVQLRKECQTRGIRWRNAHGKSKHLSKTEMLAALA